MAMSVTKFFRKYNKRLLAVFGVGLMIVFLLPSTVSQLSQRDYTKRVIGEAYGTKIKASNLLGIQTETHLLDQLNGLFSETNPEGRAPFEWRMFVQFSREKELDYYLLIQEAHQMGITVSPDKAEQLLRESQIPEGVVNTILKQSGGIPLSVLRQAVANFMSVAKALEVSASGIKVSDPELEYFFKQMNDRMTVNLVPVSAEAFADEVAAPSEAKLASYFAENQETFRYPNRVQVEYLEADVNEIKKQIKVSDDLVQDYVQNHPAEFMKTVEPAAKDGKDSATQPAQVPMSKEEAFAAAKDLLKAKKARDAARKAMSEAYVEVKRYWAEAKTNEAGVQQKPDRVADYQELADKLSKKYHVKTVYHRTPLISYQDSRLTAGIGSAFVQEHGRPLFFGDYAFRVVPFIQPPSDKNADDLRYLVPFQDSDLLRQMDRSGNIDGYYMFRVVKTDVSHLPASLAEIKDKVIREYKLSEGYKLAKGSVEALAEAAKKQKFDAIAKTKDAAVKTLLEKLEVKSVEPQTFAHRNFGYGGRLVPPLVHGVQSNPAQFADMVFDKLWDQPSTQPSGVFTTVTMPDDANRCYYVVQLVSKEPATAESFKQIKPFLLQYLTMGKQQEFLQNWFMPANIHQRTGYQSALPEVES